MNTRTRWALTKLEERHSPAVFTVTNANDSNAGSLRAAILAANSMAGADSIQFDPSYFATPRTITLTSGVLSSTGPLTITGPGAGLLTVSGNNVTSVFNITSSTNVPVLISGMTISQGHGVVGAIKSAVVSLTVSKCVISNNFGTDTGGLYVQSGTLSIASCAISNNVGANAGGAYLWASSQTITNCTIENNSATSTTESAGGIFAQSPLSLSDCQVISNHAVGGTGGVVGFSLSMQRCTIANNEQTSTSAFLASGGVTLFAGGGAVTTLMQCDISNNTAYSMKGTRGLRNDEGILNMTDCRVTGNVSAGTSSTQGYGGVYTLNLFHLSRCTISNNSGQLVGGILASTTPGGCTIANSEISHNTSTSSTTNGGGGSAGGIVAYGAITISDCTVAFNGVLGLSVAGGISTGEALSAVSVVNCTIRSNSGTYAGGVSGRMALTNCIVSGNSAGPSGVGGINGGSIITKCVVSNNVGGAIGGIYAGSTLQIESSVISSNTGGMGGGGIRQIFNGASVTQSVLRNSTVVNNNASTGGALRITGNNQGSTFTIENCSITGNTATAAYGGVDQESNRAVAIRNTIIAANMAAGLPSDIFNSFFSFSLQNCAVGSANGLTAFNNLGGNLPFGTDLKLGPLANYGGATQTISLLAGSPCIDAGTAIAGITTDQRGYLRSYGNAADIGAYELQPPRVLSVVINNGAVQRSRVTSIIINFDSALTVLPTAFKLQRQSDGQYVNLFPEYIVGGPTTSVDLSFGGALTDFGSLKDGRYTLTILNSQATNFIGALDGNGDGTPGDDYVLVGSPANGLFRLFGDADGNGVIDGLDYSAFRTAFNTNSSVFSFDGIGPVDGVDFGQFRQRFGVMV